MEKQINELANAKRANEMKLSQMALKEAYVSNKMVKVEAQLRALKEEHANLKIKNTQTVEINKKLTDLKMEHETKILALEETLKGLEAENADEKQRVTRTIIECDYVNFELRVV